MSTPSPLIPQGTFQAQAARGASNVRIAVATTLAIHIVFFGGILLQGCSRDTKTSGGNGDTNGTTTNLALAPIETNSLFYPSASNLPAEAPTSSASTPASNETFATIPQQSATPTETLWGTNLNAPTSESAVQTPEQMATGPTKEYTVARGDTFSEIAVRNHTTVKALVNANPEVDPRKIRPGMKINVP